MTIGGQQSTHDMHIGRGYNYVVQACVGCNVESSAMTR